ncbi:MAG: UDP-galactopyranose mutase [Mycoplasma sp.]|nr:UDP-galactopyranose mutase [Mycoplasma sp.]
MDIKNIYIFGSGISGSTVARIFAEHGSKVFLFEAKNHIGGHCFDYVDNQTGVYVHKYGPHIFHTSHEKVWNFVNKFSKFNSYRNKVKVNLQDREKLISFPINFTSIEEIYESEKAQKIINLLKQKYSDKKTITIGELIESNENDLKEFSDFVYKNIYSNYTSKMWGISIEDINPEVLKRVKINLDYSDNYFPDDKFQGIPSKGYTNLIRNIINHKNINLELNFDFKKRVSFKNDKLVLDSKEIDSYVFFCGSIDELFNYKFGKLSYRSLDIQFEVHQKKFYQTVGVVNYPWHKTMTRITEYKYLSKQENLEHTVISKEYPGQWDENSEKFSIRFCPIENEQNLLTLSKYKNLLKDYNIIPLGRLASYKYFDMDDAIFNAIEIAESIIHKNMQ